MQVAIVGYGIEGRSALPYWLGKGADITVCDQDEQADVPQGVAAQLGPDYLNDLDRFDVIVHGRHAP